MIDIPNEEKTPIPILRVTLLAITLAILAIGTNVILYPESQLLSVAGIIVGWPVLNRSLRNFINDNNIVHDENDTVTRKLAGKRNYMETLKVKSYLWFTLCFVLITASHGVANEFELVDSVDLIGQALLVLQSI